MRNLKKFLALVLAMVMAFSLMLTVNAANPVKDFDDASSITKEFVVAADVLTGMKVFQGDEVGFRPADTITRAEVAALIYRLATGDVDNNRTYMYANYGNFADVHESDWFAGYVGYCANAGYIKGHDGYFNPYDSVTGYEALAMILRAVGYDQNGEFTGATWETNVSALSTQLGVLDNVKTTQYGGTLYLPARRDVVADLLFQTDAKVPMVVYTTAFGYQQTGMNGGVVGTEKNPTLGLKIFGLTSSTGVIVGNQETGERVTIQGREGEKEYTGINGATLQTGMVAKWTAYNYPNTPVVDGTAVAINGAAGTAGTDDIKVDNSLFLNWTSGIDTFGHNVTFWYNGGESDGTKLGSRDNPRVVYAMFDNVKAEKLVYSANTDLTDSDGVHAVVSDNNNNHPALNTAVKNANMVISNDKAIFNTAFERLTASHKLGTHAATKVGDGTTNDVNDASNAATASPNSLYKLISNTTNVNGENVLDLVIELNIQSSKITAVDNVSSFKYVSTETSGTDFLPAANILNTTGFISQAALVGSSIKTLGANEIGWHITGTNPNATGRTVPGTETTAIQTITGQGSAVSSAYFLLGAVGTKEGVVVSYHNDTMNIPGTGWVLLDDGTQLDQSVLYNTVQASTIPQTSTNATANDQTYGSMTYRFYLDAEGNYIGAEPIMGTEYVYGTYIDFQSQLGTSQYTYRLVGVNLNGEMVTKDVTKYNNSTFNATMNPIVNIGAGLSDADNGIAIPYRGDMGNQPGSTGYTSVQPGIYRGWAVSGTAMTSDTANPANLPVPVYGYTGVAPNTAAGNMVNTFPSDIVITSQDVAIGAKRASDDADGDGSQIDPLFFTEATKFIIVSGTGTDTQKVQVYDGISELLGGNRQITIDMDGTAPASLSYITTGTVYANMVSFTMSDYVYAQDNTGTPKQANVVFLPAEAVSGVGSSLYYVGNATPMLINAYGEDATKFTMYNDGYNGEYWIEGLVDDTAAVNSRNSATIVAFGNAAANLGNRNHDQFYNLTDTGKKATDGQPIYSVSVVNEGAAVNNRFVQGIVTKHEYIATTMDAQTATICDTFTNKTTYTGALYRVTFAKVVNLNVAGAPGPLGYYWPGITDDLSTLNQASSLNNITTQVPVKVSCVLGSDNLSVDVIYVCYDQN